MSDRVDKQDRSLTQNAILKCYEELKNLSPKALVDQRMDKYAQMGVYND